MKFYDLHVHTEDIESTVQIAERLGFDGLGIVEYTDNSDEFKETKKEIKEMREETDLDLVICAEINADSIKEMKSSLSNYRELAEIVIVSGGDYAINRAASEDSRVDIIAHPEYKRTDSGLDHVTARNASENDVCLELNIGQILSTWGKTRSHILNHMERNVRLAKKFNTPLVITSGARDEWGLRDPRQLAAFGQLVNLELNESMGAVSDIPEERVETNRNKLSDKVLYEGVEVEA